MAVINQKITNRSLLDGTTPLETTINAEISKRIANYPTRYQLLNPAKTKPTLSNGWANHSGGNQLEYYKHLDNMLVLQGIIANTTTPTHVGTIFTLPDGYRPKTKQAFVVRTNNGMADITVDTTGIVSLTAYITGTSPTQVHLNVNVSLT